MTKAQLGAVVTWPNPSLGLLLAPHSTASHSAGPEPGWGLGLPLSLLSLSLFYSGPTSTAAGRAKNWTRATGSVIAPPQGQEEPPQDLLTSFMGILSPKSECSLLMDRTTCPCPEVVPIGRTTPSQENRTDPNTEVFKPTLMPPCSTSEHHLCGKKGRGAELTPNIC